MSVHDWIPRRPYDEQEELSAYAWTHLRQHLTEEEMAWQGLYIRMQALLRGRRTPWEMGKEKIERYLQEQISDFDWFHLQDPQAYLNQVRERILSEHGEEIEINRCPTCDGVLRTPKARQCFWGCRRDVRPGQTDR